MKKIYLLTLATLFGLNLMAQKSNVVVFSEDGDSFFAFLNGVKQNATAQSNVRITDIPGQAASLRIVFANSNAEPVKKNLMFDPAGMEHTIKLKKDKKGVIKMQYFGSVAIAQSTSSVPAMTYTPTDASSGTVNPANTTNAQVSDPSTNNTQTVNTTSTSGNGSVNMNTQVSDPSMNGSTQTVSTTTTTTSTSNNTGGNGNVNMTIGVGNNGMNMNVNVSGDGDPSTGSVSGNINMNTGTNVNGTTTSSQTVTTTTTTSSSSSGTYNSNTTTTTTGTDPNANVNYNTSYNTTADPNTYNTTNYNTTGNTTATNTTSGGCFYAMDDASFVKMKGTIEKADFSDTRMSTAKTATRNNCLSTEQVKTIMDLFDMDDDKLDYAKFAYDYTVDKNNFYTLGEQLTFDGNKNALNQFIESKR